MKQTQQEREAVIHDEIINKRIIIGFCEVRHSWAEWSFSHDRFIRFFEPGVELVDCEFFPQDSKIQGGHGITATPRDLIRGSFVTSNFTANDLERALKGVQYDANKLGSHPFKATIVICLNAGSAAYILP